MLRRRLALAVVAVLAGGLLVGLVSLASGTTSGREAAGPKSLVRIVSPHRDGLVRSGTVKIVVRTAPGVKRLAATVGLRHIGRRFRRHGRRWTARVRLAPGLRHLFVLAKSRDGREAADLVRFVVVTPRRGFLKVTRHRPSSWGGQLGIHVRTDRKPWRFRAFLNRHRVDSAFIKSHPLHRVASLDGDHGLRHGWNTLVIEAFHRKGAYDRVVRRFYVRRNRPLAGAGNDRRTTVGHPVRLDARGSRPTRRGHRLTYRWVIARAPRGSSARLRSPRAKRPLLLPDRFGTYSLRLIVRESGGRLLARESGPLLTGGDEVQLDILPHDPPIGVKIDTVPAAGKGIAINGSEVTQAQKQGVEVVVLKRRTRQVLQAQSFSIPQHLDDLQRLVQKTDLNDLVIMTGGGRQVSLSHKQANALLGIIKAIGGTDRGLGAIDGYGFGHGQWSVIGSNGFPEGAANQNVRTFPGSSLGTMQGRLASGAAGYTFVAADSVTYDTGAIIRPGFNRMRIGSASYDSLTIGAGFHVVVLDQDTLQPLKNLTLITCCPPPDFQSMGKRNMALLQPLMDQARTGKGPPLLVLVESINDPGPQDNGMINYQVTDNLWFNLVKLMAVNPSVGPLRSNSLGATLDVLNSLAHGYALVGGTNLPDYAPAETSTAPTGGYARLRGALTRNRQSQWVSEHWGLNGSVPPDFYRLAYQDPTSWPASDTARKRAANSYLATQLGLSETSDVRINYYENPTVFSGGSNATIRSRLADTGDRQYIRCPADRSDFSKDDCEAVKNALINELPAVDRVISDFDALKYIFTGDSNHVTVSVHKIATDIAKKFAVPPHKKAEVDWLSFGGAVAHIGEALGSEIPGVGAAFGLASASLEIASVFSDNGDENPEIPLPDRLSFQADDLADSFDGAIGQMSKELPFVRNLILSDYAKLTAADQMISKTREWDFRRADLQAEIIRGFNTSAAQAAWGALLPTAYPYVWQLTNSLYQNPPGCGRHIPDSNFYQVLSDYAEGRPKGVPRNTKVVATGNSHNDPPASVTSSLFKPVEPDGGFGLSKPVFYGQNFAPKSTGC